MKKTMFGAALLCALGLAQAADLPTATEIQKNMGMGYNIGNSMEVYGNPTAWSNPYPTQALLDSIKAAGFSTVRIPCAWDSHAEGGVIKESWLDSVKTVVDYAMRAGLYTILNIHHEASVNGQAIGWFQVQMATTKNEAVNTKMKNYWTQIATKFKDYDEHLLFAGANEPGEGQKGLKWSSQHAQVLMGYYQTFIDAVRATGGNNASRTLIIQGPQTDIDKSIEFAPTTIFPTDKISGRLMFEVHFYGPYQYVLMTEAQNWGADEMIEVQYYYGDYKKASEPKRNCGYNAWAHGIDASLDGITYPNTQFAKMKSNYVSKGYPVIIGEFGSLYRSPDLSGDDLELHRKGRIQWHKDVVSAAKNNGVTPILWDMGNEAAKYDNMAYIRRQTNNFGGQMGNVIEPEIINAMRGVYGLGTYNNTGITHTEAYIPTSTPEVSSSSVVPESSGSELTAMGNTHQAAAATLTRQGNLLMAQGERASIRLFDTNGNLVRQVSALSSKATLSLAGLNKGMYIAKSGNRTLQVRIK